MKTSSCWVLLYPRKPNCFVRKTPSPYNFKSFRQLRIGCPEKKNAVFVCDVRYVQTANFLGRHTRIRCHPAGLCTFFAPTMVLPWWVGIDNGETFLCHTTQAICLQAAQQKLLRMCNGTRCEPFILIDLRHQIPAIGTLGGAKEDFELPKMEVVRKITWRDRATGEHLLIACRLYLRTAYSRSLASASISFVLVPFRDPTMNGAVDGLLFNSCGTRGATFPSR
jgi:hypothetical protein